MCNINDGGEGCALCGENNGMYGKGYLISGENNPMYGKGYLMSGENNPMYGRCGENHPMYGKKRPEISGENNPMYGKNYRDYMTEEAKKKRDEKMTGKNNPQAKSVIAIINDKIFGAFDYAKQGAEYFGCNHGNIVNCCKGKIKSAGKYNCQKIIWKYITIIEL